jgi:hypothetical protein
MPHDLTRIDIDLGQLADELGAKLGRDITLTARLPEQPDGEPGVLHVLDSDGQDIDVPAATVESIVAAHVPQHVPPLTDDEITALRSMLATR